MSTGITRDGTDLTMTEAPLLLTVTQAATVLSISRTTLYELLASGAVESIRIGRSRRVPVDALHAYVESRRRDSRER